MKLMISKTENDYRAQLIESRSSLFSDPKNRSLLEHLRNHYPELKTAYVIGWTPEQGEDIYRILVNTDTVCAIELSHDQEEPPLIESFPLNEYEKNLSKTGRIKFAVAVDLATIDIRS